jgi:ATP-binding cassette, subfamily B, bacterial
VDIAKQQSGTKSFRDVIVFSVRHWLRQPWLLALMCATVAGWISSELLMPVFAGKLIDAVASTSVPREDARDAAVAALVTMVALGFALVAMRHVTFLAIVRFTLRIMSDVARDTFARVQRFSTDWHANTFAGSTVRRISRGMWAFDTLNDTALLSLMPSLFVLVGSTLLLGLRWPVMGVVVGTGAVGYVLQAANLSLRYVAPSARLANQWDTRVGGALADAITCNAVVKSFGAEAREDARLDAVLARWRKRTRRTWVRGTNSGSLQASSLVLLRGTVVGTSLWMWWRGAASAGDVTYVLTTYFVVHGYLRDVGQQMANLQRAVNDMEEMVAMQSTPLGVADAPGAVPIAITDGRVAFEHVTFHYGRHATPLYEDLDVVIAGGERVGLVGHSGSGKSTFVKLVQRFYDVSEGRIVIDGQDIARVTQASLRSRIAVVQQDPVLFHRSLAENIAYGRPGASPEAVEHAAHLANAHEFIARLPSGYATLVGERGVKLSGGERQRVALARAFLADAPILILDEATSSLDSEAEAMIQEAMLRLMTGRTAIVIAHRLSTVRALDRILVFEHGRIVEQGSHTALLGRDGIYRRLFERQALGLIEDATRAA